MGEVSITGGPGRASLALKLPAGDLGTDCTILAMRAIAEHASTRPRIKAVAAKLGRSRERLYEFLRDGRRYKDDTPGVEHLRDPERVLAAITAGKVPGIDCDDVATLGVAIIKAMEWPAAFVVIGKRPYPAKFRHVFYATHNDTTPPAGYAWPEGVLPIRFEPWDPQEAKRVPMGKMAKAARVKVFPA